MTGRMIRSVNDLSKNEMSKTNCPDDGRNETVQPTKNSSRVEHS